MGQKSTHIEVVRIILMLPFVLTILGKSFMSEWETFYLFIAKFLLHNI
jgi:hypothetical protein